MTSLTSSYQRKCRNKEHHLITDEERAAWAERQKEYAAPLESGKAKMYWDKRYERIKNDPDYLRDKSERAHRWYEQMKADPVKWAAFKTKSKRNRDAARAKKAANEQS